ncbi:MAG TPA: sulfite exporter TauE/SafE family protein [Acidobacteriaceae bacterium]|nr:sulfite exporter TauE/SafE family protein [Acidobacteriaceae bacterium]
MIPSLGAHVHYLWLVATSFLAGVMNAMAGGGSFISFPAMLAIGVPPIQANATNTVALWPGQLTSIWALRMDLRRDLLAVVCSASVVGGISGAEVLLHTRQITFMRMVPWLLLTASLLFGVSGPVSRWLRRRSSDQDLRLVRPPAMLPLFLAIVPVTFYIGYFGAGAGFLLMSALALFGIDDMNALNSLKVLAACLSNFCAVVTFIFGGAIVWHYCLISMIFAAMGGYAGAQYARSMNPNVLRTIVVVTGCGMAAYFFWRQP